MEDSHECAPDWEKMATECRGCHRGFTMTRRRHHCRACGRIFCGTCSKHKDVLPPQYQLEGTHRTCDLCHRDLKRLEISQNPDDHPPQPDAIAVKTALLEKLKVLTETGEDQWVEKANKKGIVIDALKIEDSNLFCVRSRFSLKAPLEKVVSMYGDRDLWKEWQPEMIKCTPFEQINENEEYMYVLYKVPLLDKREVVVYSSMCEGSIENPGDTNERCLISTSVLHPLIGRTKGVVRADLSFGYTRFYPGEDGESTNILSAYHTNPRGMIPPSLVNSTIARVADQLHQMRTFMESNDHTPPEIMSGHGNPVLMIRTPVEEGGEEEKQTQVFTV
eukprot:m.134865 g.134865  ORF g.134865 m.134865 type:complete len:333 (+) comp9760_c0_seq1:117-1115(+)